MGRLGHQGAGRRRRRSRTLAVALCACAFLAFSARAARLRPGHLQHVICKAPATVPTYSWLSDGPEFAVVVSVSGHQLSVTSAPILPLAPRADMRSWLEFSQYVRPPPAF